MDANANGSSVVRYLCRLLSNPVLNALKLLQVLGMTFVSYCFVIFWKLLNTQSATPNQEQHSALELLSVIITVLKTTSENNDTKKLKPVCSYWQVTVVHQLRFWCTGGKKKVIWEDGPLRAVLPWAHCASLRMACPQVVCVNFVGD